MAGYPLYLLELLILVSSEEDELRELIVSGLESDIRIVNIIILYHR